MRWLIGCERSGRIRNALRARGHDAWSCDLEEADDGSPYHIKHDVIEVAYSRGPWDAFIVHPECTYLCNSSSKHLYAGKKKENGPEAERWARMGAAAQFFLTCWRAPIKRKCVENPIMLPYPRQLFGIKRATQIVQPWMFGTPETKGTGLWIDGLMPLRPIYTTWEECRVALGLPEGAKPHPRIHRMPPTKDRRRARSETYECIADAMAEQWAGEVESMAA